MDKQTQKDVRAIWPGLAHGDAHRHKSQPGAQERPPFCDPTPFTKCEGCVNGCEPLEPILNKSVNKYSSCQVVLPWTERTHYYIPMSSSASKYVSLSGIRRKITRNNTAAESQVGDGHVRDREPGGFGAVDDMGGGSPEVILYVVLLSNCLFPFSQTTVAQKFHIFLIP
jgi:hypothetical protein